MEKSSKKVQTMMANKSQNNGPIAGRMDYGVTINHILRYGYSGLFSLLIFSIIIDVDIYCMLRELGPTLIIIAAFVFGAIVYAIYRVSIGPFTFFIIYWLHRLLEPIWGFRPFWWSKYFWGCSYHNKHEVHNCTRHYLQDKYEVCYLQHLTAFRIIRESEFFKLDQLFLRQHSEIHILYITTTILLAGIFALWLLPPCIVRGNLPNNVNFIFILVCLASWLSGMLWDISVDRHICAYIKTLDGNKIIDHLKVFKKS